MALLCSQMLAEDWPTYRHDSYRSGVSGEDLRAERLQTSWVWRSAHPPQPAWPGPAKWDAYAGIKGLQSMRDYDPVFHTVIVGEKLYFSSTVDDTIRCLDTRRGSVLWTYHTDAPVRIAPEVVDGRLYVGSDDGMARCLDALTGKLLWSYRPREVDRWILNNGRWIPFWPIRTGVTVVEGTAYFAASLLPWKESYLCAVDALTGLPEGSGRYVTRLEETTFEGALLVSDDHLVAPQGRVSPLIYRRSDAALLGGLKGGGGCFVMLTPQAEILHGPGNKTGWVTGSQLNNQTTYATFKDARAMVVDGGTTYMLTESSLSALDRQDRQELWGLPVDRPLTLIKGGGDLYIGAEDRCLAFDAETGQALWEASLPGKVHGLALANGALYTSTDQGEIHCFRALAPEDYQWEEVEMASHQEALPPVRQIESVEANEMVARWVFHREALTGKEVANQAGDRSIRLVGKGGIEQIGDLETLILDGSTSGLIQGDMQHPDLPKEQFSVEAWVRVDEPLAWGGIIGAIQDNGAYEKGWLLGFRDQRFSFALNAERGADQLLYMAAEEDFELRRWYYVAATYDGQEMILYQDGQPMIASSSQQGMIQYPPAAFYEVGAYHDQDEHYQTQGRLHEVRVHHRALKPKEILEQSKRRRFPLPAPAAPRLELALGPVLSFSSPSSACVEFETHDEAPVRVVLEYEGDLLSIIPSMPNGLAHKIELMELPYRRAMTYRIEQRDDQGNWVSTDPFDCDTLFNFTPPQLSSWPDMSENSQAIEASQELLHHAGVRQGVAVFLGAARPALWHTMAAQTPMRVMAFSNDPKLDLGMTRRLLTDAGSYGVRVALQALDPVSPPPLVDWFANLMVSDLNDSGLSMDWLLQIMSHWLRPDGGVGLIRVDAAQRTAANVWMAQAARHGLTAQWSGPYLKLSRGPLIGAGEWSHQYGDAANGAFGGESLQGARGTQDLEVQWLGRPGPRAQPDRNGRKPSPLSTGGRLFVQGLHRILALDAYNGSVLWSREVPRLQRFNMPRDSSNWAADAKHLYTAMEGHCWQWDAETGELERVFQIPGAADASTKLDWSYVSPQADQLIGSAVTKDAAYSNFWGGGNAGWYDAKSGEVTHKVSSENLFALEANSGDLHWNYQGGLIINSTITLAEDRIWFVEARDPSLRQGEPRRLEGEALWQDLALVCLNRHQGQPLYVHPLAIEPGTVALYLAQGGDKVVLVASGQGAYHVYARNVLDGLPNWSQKVNWPQDHHGGHMARPAIVGDVLYVRPAALSLVDGSRLAIEMPGGGCGTYAASEKALFFRSGNVTVWDQQQGSSSAWNRLRPDCWLSTIPAAGLLLSPEGGGGCSCGSWLETSIVFAPKM